MAESRPLGIPPHGVVASLTAVSRITGRAAERPDLHFHAAHPLGFLGCSWGRSLAVSETLICCGFNAMPITSGVLIGPYRIESKLGEGGMGTVYRALDTKLNRPVAIKFLSNELADAAARRRFQREAQMASSLNHPHIVTVYDAGDLEGRQYLVTEYIDGGTLRDWAKV